MRYLRVYKMLSEPVFSLGGACEWFQGEFQFIIKTEKFYEVWCLVRSGFTPHVPSY